MTKFEVISYSPKMSKLWWCPNIDILQEILGEHEQEQLISIIIEIVLHLHSMCKYYHLPKFSGYSAFIFLGPHINLFDMSDDKAT